jgi:hypothetical protein
MWPSLQPPRTICIPLLAGYLFGIAALLTPLCERIASKALLAHLTLAAAFVALAIAWQVSLRYGRPAGIAAAALGGCAAAAWFSSQRVAVGGLSLAYAIVVGGWAFIACIEPNPPAVGFLLAPLAPLALWCCARGPLARLRGPSAAGAQIALVLVPLGIAAGLLVWKSIKL